MRTVYFFLGLCLFYFQSGISAPNELIEQMIAKYRDGGSLDSLVVQWYADEKLKDWSEHFDDISSGLSSDSLAAWFFYDLASAVSAARSAHDALKLMEESISRSIDLKDTALLIKGYNDKAFVLNYIGKYEEAIRLYFHTLQLIDTYYYTEGSAAVLGNLAGAFLSVGDVENAILYQRKSIIQEQLRGNLRGETVSIFNLGNAYYEKGDYDSALWCYSKTLELSEPQGWTDLVAYSYGNMASVYLERGLYTDAIASQKRGLAMEEALEEEVITIESHLVLGSAYAHLGNHEGFHQHLNKAMEIAARHDIKTRMVAIYESQAEAYEVLGDYKEALLAFKRFQALTDSLQGVELSRFKLDMQEKYETQQKEAANQMLVLENQEKEGKIIRQRVYLTTAVVVIFLIFFLFVFIYRSHLHTRRLNRQITAQTAELAAVNRSKDRLFSIISHDLRGPIASFESLTAIIKNYLQRRDIEKVDELIGQVDRSARTLNQLLDNLLNWSMSQQNEVSLDIRPIDVETVINEVIDVYEEAARTKGIVIKTEGSGGKVLADYHTFSTVVRNLVSNALKFSPEGSEVKITYRAVNRFVELVVEDRGIGIPEENIHRLFQIDKAKVRRGTAREKGTGLGLVLVKDFVHLNNGRIEVSSTPGMGTTFRLSLPLAS